MPVVEEEGEDAFGQLHRARDLGDGGAHELGGAGVAGMRLDDDGTASSERGGSVAARDREG